MPNDNTAPRVHRIPAKVKMHRRKRNKLARATRQRNRKAS